MKAIIIPSTARISNFCENKGDGNFFGGTEAHNNIHRRGGSSKSSISWTMVSIKIKAIRGRCFNEVGRLSRDDAAQAEIDAGTR